MLARAPANMLYASLRVWTSKVRESHPKWPPERSERFLGAVVVCLVVVGLEPTSPFDDRLTNSFQLFIAHFPQWACWAM